jgi:hypothetical protein
MVDVSFHRSGKQGTEQIHQRVLVRHAAGELRIGAAYQPGARVRRLLGFTPEVACFYMEGLLDSAVLAAHSRFKNVGLAVQARP